ncbi:Nif3-like dinuclear metal center hexameric protein [Zavarzinella formosa]|uniref:Nif3-like dinuclear metal center hexameric protein n=1 Tax=Zavarzinella formosa TaxID=360055 RepID=UPI0002F489E7|nr:Nif3-like dinuclear metal center hexameric protein [Zavarzinella formosa]
MSTVADFCRYFEAFTPSSLAADWDNVGLLLGERTTDVHRAITCLTVTPEVVAEAVDGLANLIVSHHPILFRGTKKLSGDSSEGRLLLPLLKAGIAVYSPHTAFDNATGGINDQLAATLGLTNVRPLRRHDAERRCKIVVFTPTEDVAAVSAAMFQAGAGVIGEYRECSFRLPGTGTFFGTEGTNPAVGEKGRRMEVPEERLEVICPERAVNAVIAAMRKAHRYEEPAFDVYPLKPLPGSNGEGRLGELPAEMSLELLAGKIKTDLRTGAVQLVGEPTKTVSRVAIACGAAGEFLKDAIKAKADVFLTGEMRFHDYLHAESEGLGLLLPGHYASERPAVENLAVRLAKDFPDVTVTASSREHDPVSWV